MPAHGVNIDEQQGGIRPTDTEDGAAIGLLAHCSEQTEGDLIALMPDTDISDHDDGTGTIGPIYSMIRKHSSAPVIVSCVDALNLADAAGDAGAFTFAFRLLQAESELGIKPKLLPQALVGNIESDLVSVAARLKGQALLDGPNTDDSAAIAGVASYDAKQAGYHDPGVIDTNDVVIGSSVPYAAIGSAMDFWKAVSNQPVLGIKGTSRTIGFAMGDENSQANLLNEAKINTIIRQDGWRLWGGLSTSADPQFKFLNVARTDDVIQESILLGFLWAVDRGIGASFVDEVVDSVREFLRNLKARDAIVDGDAWADKTLNTPTSLAAGDLYIDYKFTPKYPAHTIIMRRHITNEYLTQIFG